MDEPDRGGCSLRYSASRGGRLSGGEKVDTSSNGQATATIATRDELMIRSGFTLKSGINFTACHVLC